MAKELPSPVVDQQPTSYEQPSSHGQQPPLNYEQPAQQQAIVTHLQSFTVGPQPTIVVCPVCHTQVTTLMEIENGVKTHIVAVVLCLVFFPLAWVPYTMDRCKCRHHYCPVCKAYIGRYQNMPYVHLMDDPRK